MRYELYKLEYISTHGSVLFRARVVVELDITIDELKEVGQKIKELINVEYDALIIELYDEGAEVWKEGTFGSIEIYPYGRHGKALNINRIGRERGGRTDSTMIIYIFDKDYRERPTEMEYKIFRIYVDFVDFYGRRDNVPENIWDKFCELYKLNNSTKDNAKRIWELIHLKCIPWCKSRKYKNWYDSKKG